LAFIIKSDPPEVYPDGVYVVEERMRYRAQPQSGEAVYVWEAEPAGGRGLAMRGHIEQINILGTASSCGYVSIRPQMCRIEQGR
jgi:hypothetical protein